MIKNSDVNVFLLFNGFSWYVLKVLYFVYDSIWWYVYHPSPSQKKKQKQKQKTKNKKQLNRIAGAVVRLFCGFLTYNFPVFEEFLTIGLDGNI